MKKIALLKKDFHLQGGLEKATRKIIEAFQERGFPVTLLTASPIDAPCHVRKCALKSRLNFRKMQEFDQWCQKIVQDDSYDVVLSMDRSSFQTHHRAGNGVHAAYLRLRREQEGFLKTVTFALNPLHRVLLQLEKSTFEDPALQGVIVNSHLVKEQILDCYSTPLEKIQVIHNGVEWTSMETDFQHSFSNKKEIARLLHLDPDYMHFLFVGHNFQRKGLFPLLQALNRLSRRDFHLSVVGTDKNSDLYKKATAQLGLLSHVTFFGSQPHTRPFYQMADVLVIPSLYDPFANVTVEALAMGLFVISSKMNGGHEVLTPSSGIVLEDPCHSEAFTAALERAFQHPKKISQAQLIRNSVEHLDFAHQMEKVCALCLT